MKTVEMNKSLVIGEPTSEVRVPEEAPDMFSTSAGGPPAYKNEQPISWTQSRLYGDDGLLAQADDDLGMADTGRYAVISSAPPPLSRQARATTLGRPVAVQALATDLFPVLGTPEAEDAPMPPPSSQTPERPRRSYGRPIPLQAEPVAPPTAMKPTVVLRRVAAETVLVPTIVPVEQFDREITNQDNGAWKPVLTAFALGILATATVVGAAALLLR
jgi:hypothetical protein